MHKSKLRSNYYIVKIHDVKTYLVSILLHNLFNTRPKFDLARIFGCQPYFAISKNPHLYKVKTYFNFVLNLFTAYAILHFITMAALPVIWINSYVYSTEIFAPKWRIVFIGVFEIPIGYYIFGLIAYLNRTWTEIHIWVGIATALTLPLYFILPESPRDHP